MVTLPAAIFFDFDGVILESSDIKTDAFVELFAAYPELVPAIREHHLKNMGVSRYKKFTWIYENLLHRTIDQQELDNLGARFSVIALDKILQAPFVPGALHFLQAACKQCPCFVASGTPEEELRQIVKSRGLMPYFQEVCGTPRTKTEIVKTLLTSYRLEANRCWFIGDANTDFEAASSTGLQFIARSTPLLEEYWKEQQNIRIIETFQPLLADFSV